MIRFTAFAAAASSLCLASVAVSQPVLFDRPLSDRAASYSIAVTLDPQLKQLKGSETITWRNTSRENVAELQFHLYLNAFRDRSTFLQRRRSHSAAGESQGWSEIHALQSAEGEDLTSRMQFIHPDDDNSDDRTVFRVPLRRPVRPGQTITLTCTFTAQLPAVIARTGYAGNFFMAGQWFPKLGVYEAGKGWNCHQFHPNTEFFADFGVYDIAITVPDRFTVGATGVRYAERKNDDRTKTLFYHAEDVHDFAWSASPFFREITEQWRHVTIRLLLQPDHASSASRYLSSCIAALEFFDRHVGPYPYTTLTIIDPPMDGIEAGGMEYPTLFTVTTAWGMPEAFRFPELVTIHEFGHQYWQGMSASNEFEEAWLDEGVNQYYEVRLVDSLYGKKSSLVDLFGFHAGDGEWTRASFTRMANPRIAPPATPAWKFPPGTYGILTYNKTAIALLTLERMIGQAAMDSALSGFFHRWRFRHPAGKDFVAAFNPSLKGFFDQTIFGTTICDFEVTAIRNTPFEPASDTIHSGTSQPRLQPPGIPPDSARYTASVLVSRRGDMVLPLEVLVHFDDGSELLEHWDGKATYADFTYRSRSPVRWAKVDPGEKLPLDVDLTNNSRAVDPPEAPAWRISIKILFWFQNALFILGLLS